MMLYCEHCMMLCDPDCVKCPDCGNRGLRLPKPNDPTHVLSIEALWSGGIEEILAQAEIPCLKQRARGTVAAIIIGELSETYRYFVPFAALEKSKELLCDFIDRDGADDMTEFDGEDECSGAGEHHD